MSLVAPCKPIWPRPARKHFEERAGATILDQSILFVGLARMLALTSADVIYLSPARIEGAGIFSSNAEKQNLRDVTKIKSNSSTIRSTVFTKFVPDDIGFVFKAPCRKHLEAVRKQSVWNPKIKMRSRPQNLFDRKGRDLVYAHRIVAGKATMSAPFCPSG